jgi:hypothetical protein
VLKAEAEAKGWRRLYETTQKMIASNEGLITTAVKKRETLQRDAANEIGQANKWLAEAENLRKRSSGSA